MVVARGSAYAFPRLDKSADDDNQGLLPSV